MGNKNPKPLGIKNYGSIPHLSNSKLGPGDMFITPGQENIITIKTRDKHDNILAYEKYDGSNVGIAKKNGKIWALTRSGYEAKTSQYRQHILFHMWVLQRERIFMELLQEGERITGEWLAQACGIRYNIGQHNDPIVFFDYFTPDNQRLIDIDFYGKIGKYALRGPRLLHAGGPVKVESLIPKLNERTNGIQAVEDPEGMVFRVERKGKVDFLAKWVRKDFPTGSLGIGVDEKDIIWNI